MKHKNIKSGILAIHIESQTKVEIMGFKENSRTIVNVKDTDRGKGWCENKQEYIGYFVPNGWCRGENFAYGTWHEVHIKSIEQINM